jgi:hypothetical protein
MLGRGRVGIRATRLRYERAQGYMYQSSRSTLDVRVRTGLVRGVDGVPMPRLDDPRNALRVPPGIFRSS